jgi:coenzyme F420-dependent glucose-6-phosphate dehydrogenase
MSDDDLPVWDVGALRAFTRHEAPEVRAWAWERLADRRDPALAPAVAEGLAKVGRAGAGGEAGNAAGTGAGGAAYDRMIEIKLSWDPDPERALANTRFWAPLSLSAEQKHSIHSPGEMERAADELPIEQVARRWVVASKPEEVVEALRAYTDLGFSHLVLHGPGHDQERFLTTLAEQVLPGLRELVPRAG